MSAYSFNGVGDSDFQEGGEVGDPRAACVSKNGELGQEDVQGAPLGRQGQ